VRVLAAEIGKVLGLIQARDSRGIKELEQIAKKLIIVNQITEVL